jgi:hypothetical protein
MSFIPSFSPSVGTPLRPLISLVRLMHSTQCHRARFGQILLALACSWIPVAHAVMPKIPVSLTVLAEGGVFEGPDGDSCHVNLTLGGETLRMAMTIPSNPDDGSVGRLFSQLPLQPSIPASKLVNCITWSAAPRTSIPLPLSLWFHADSTFCIASMAHPVSGRRLRAGLNQRF